MNIAPLLAAVVAASAAAQSFTAPAELAAAVARSRALAASAPASVALLRSPVMFRAAALGTPINTGFLGLGAAGKTGRISGPPLGGNGTYRVIENDAAQMVFDMKTGYVVGRFTLRRDAATGKDSLGFDGRTKSGPFSGWTPSKGIYDGEITYNAGSDSGTIRWQLDGQEVRDSYNGGRAGSRSMTITLKGHKHVFTQD
jgi:hypothetical protein